jgi:DNA repair exonuclease SbcCD ATPase subunit
MMRKPFFMLRLLAGALVLTLAIGLADCTKGKRDDEPIDDAQLASKSREELAEEVRRLTITASEKDSLFNEVVETTKFISEVYTELSSLSGELNTRGVEQKSPDYRQEITKKIQLLSKKMQDNEKRLKENQSRISELKRSNTKFANQIASYEQVIADLNVIIQTQKEEIGGLNTKVAELSGKVASLTEERAALNDQVSTLTEETNTCYYVVGTQSFLESNKIIDRKGTVLGFIGGKRVPNDNLNLSAFTAVNITRQTEISLPGTLNEVVSTHNLQYIKVSEDKKKITITDPKKFWQTSRYLIVVIDG